MTMYCRTLDDVEYQSANGIGNPIWQIEVLCAEIRNLNRRLAKLEDSAKQQDKEIVAHTYE